ncbi:MAG: hypothetical protein FWF90_07980 [Promicromonosporaceae bacterium]|nr:hypothetical protein [Promicromonosporaceae bacterium]
MSELDQQEHVAHDSVDPAPPGATSQATEPDVAVPILIFAPGFARSATNNGVRLAEIVANNASLLPGTYKAVESQQLASPGLRVCRTILGPAGTPVLEVLELDYLGRLEDKDLIGDRARSTPGFVRTSLLALRGLVMLVPAWSRAGKSSRAKLQLLIGFVMVALLLLLAVAAVLAALKAMGIGTGFVGDDTTARFAIGTGVSVSAIWAFARPKFASAAQRIERIMDFADRQRYRASVVKTLWEALDGLRDRETKGPIHLVGFSFGSLVLLEALYPQKSGDNEDPGANLAQLASAVRSLTTVGCPADFVRLYWPEWFRDRCALAELDWLNIYNASDVFGSNFRNDRDGATARTPAWPRLRRRRNERPVPDSPMRPTKSVMYLPPKPRWKLALMGDIAVHGEYWDSATADNCFARTSVLDMWFHGIIPAPSGEATAAPGVTDRTQQS